MKLVVQVLIHVIIVTILSPQLTLKENYRMETKLDDREIELATAMHVQHDSFITHRITVRVDMGKET